MEIKERLKRDIRVINCPSQRIRKDGEKKTKTLVSNKIKKRENIFF